MNGLRSFCLVTSLSIFFFASVVFAQENPLPVITSVSPNPIALHPGESTTVVINGENLLPQYNGDVSKPFAVLAVYTLDKNGNADQLFVHAYNYISSSEITTQANHINDQTLKIQLYAVYPPSQSNPNYDVVPSNRFDIVFKEPVAVCGNGIKEEGEQCDGGDLGICGSCDSQCKCLPEEDPALAEIDMPIVFTAMAPMGYWSGSFLTTYQMPDASKPGAAPRGSALFIRYPDGSTKNLTEAGGFVVPKNSDGSVDANHPNSVAVGRFAGHPFDTNRGMIPLAVGPNSKWQIYEVVGLGKNDTPLFTKVAGQKTDRNNYDVVYDSAEPDKLIYYVSDQIFIKNKYPNHPISMIRDEYDVIEAGTAMIQLNLETQEHEYRSIQPSGLFRPTTDSFGRVIYRVWVRKTGDMMDIESQNDPNDPYGHYGAFNNPSEAPEDFYTISPTIASLVPDVEPHVHPEPHHSTEKDKSINALSTELEFHNRNHDLPFMFMRGGGETTVNHIGPHQMFGYLNATQADGHTETFYNNGLTPAGTLPTPNFFAIRESLKTPGKFLYVNSDQDYLYKSFQSGRIVSMQMNPGMNADQMAQTTTYITDPNSINSNEKNVGGKFAEPWELPNGEIIADWIQHGDIAKLGYNNYTGPNFSSNYVYTPYVLKKSGQYYQPGTPLISPINIKVNFEFGETYSGPASVRFLHPIVQKVAAPKLSTEIDPEVLEAFNEVGVDPVQFQQFLKANNLAMIVMRNVLQREKKDRQQPFNLRLADSPLSVIGAPGEIVYPIKYLRVFQGDLTRGYKYKGDLDYSKGRRFMPKPIHDGLEFNLPQVDAPEGSFEVKPDGSAMAIIPANRPNTWEIADPDGKAVVRERIWLTHQGGEIVFCKGCHGLDTVDQAGNAADSGSGMAIREYLKAFKSAIDG